LRSTPVAETAWFVVWIMATTGGDIELVYLGPEEVTP
jgi:hypothetical protein